ncbi:MAG: futalosine hydrolase, partial [Bacteroidetes bacterium]|nr:futalosine hydrolase [Bacteroidota bacterium]
MKILLVAATKHEIESFVVHHGLTPGQYKTVGNHLVSVLITGAGLLHTAFALQAEINRERPDFILNAGVAGSFDNQLEIESIVWVKKEFPGDFGALSPEGFLPAAGIGLLQADIFPFTEGGIVAQTPFFNISGVTQVQSITVQQVTGTIESIRTMRETWPQAQIENMEGLAVFYVASMLNIPFAEIRSISNRVEPR